ncbi:hypothetical protein JYT20_01445 [Rhodothermus sp. AH-315-K08]|nr:hypothetical protein [Rhodothermus sp. AH-315-K08]
MKRHYALGGALLLVLSTLVVACSGDLLENQNDAYDNPYLAESQSLVTSLIESAVEFTSPGRQRGPIHHSHGELLLEALASAPGVDIDVPRLSGTLFGPERARKGRDGDLFPGETTLSSAQKKHLDHTLARAAKATGLEDLGRLLSESDARTLRDLGAEAARPILIVSAGLFAQYEYFTDPSHAGTIRRLVWQIRDADVVAQVNIRSARGRVRVLKIQDSGDGRGANPPPFWGQFFNPGEWWSQTVRDTREAAELGILGGAGIGCLVGAIPTAGVGCGPGGAAGGLIGGLFGILVGGIAAGVANYEESQHGFEVAETEWCQDQSRMGAVLRHFGYASRCDASQN